MTATGMRALENRFYALIRHRSAESVAAAEPATGPTGVDTFADADYCLVVTYRRDGTPVPTPVWFALRGERIVFQSDSDSAKVKRLGHDPRVRVAPCNSRGRPSAAPLDGVARLLDPNEKAAAERALAEKYGLSRRISNRLRPTPPGHTYVEVRIPGGASSR